MNRKERRARARLIAAEAEKLAADFTEYTRGRQVGIDDPVAQRVLCKAIQRCAAMKLQPVVLELTFEQIAAFPTPVDLLGPQRHWLALGFDVDLRVAYATQSISYPDLGPYDEKIACQRDMLKLLQPELERSGFPDHVRLT